MSVVPLRLTPTTKTWLTRWASACGARGMDAAAAWIPASLTAGLMRVPFASA